MEKNLVTHRHGLADSRLQPLTDPILLDDLLARVADRTQESWLVRENARTARRTSEDSLLEFLVAAETQICRTADLDNPVMLWVDDVEQPQQILVDKRQEQASTPQYLLLETLLSKRKSRGWRGLSWFSRAAESEIYIDEVLDAAVSASLQAEVESEAVPELVDGHKVSRYVPQADSSVDFSVVQTSANKPVKSLQENDNLWALLHGSAASGWYVVQRGEPLPSTPMTEQQLHRFLLDISEEVRQHEVQKSAVFVMADDLSKPTFVKIFQPDPQLAAEESAQPIWTISLSKPVAVNTD